MNTHETYVSLETAKLLKQAGFDWECMCYYSVNTLHEPNNGFIHIYKQYRELFYDHNKTKMPVYSAPTLAVAQRWLREVKGWILETYYFGEEFFGDDKVDIESDLLRKYPNKSFYMCYGYFENCMYIEEDGNTYEDSLEAGIKKALEIILEKGE